MGTWSPSQADGSGNKTIKYAVIVSARNAGSTIGLTVDSILRQSLQAVQVCVVDDGSTDETLRILDKFRGRLRILRRPDRGYDIRRVPANFNLAYRNLDATIDYLMISGDDCVYPKEYAHSLISSMSLDPRLVVASGRPRTDGDVLREHSPSGSGRMIKHSFWRYVGGGYPVNVGWETWLLYKALQEGLRTEQYEDLIYEHLRPRGSMHQFTYWGSAMYCLGYHPLYALGRVSKNLFRTEVSFAGTMKILAGYMLALVGSSDPFISSFEPPVREIVREYQARRISNVVSHIVKRIPELIWK